MEMKDKIKDLRANLGLTLEEVGDYVGVGKSTVRKWENGMIANMKRDKIAKLAEVLHTTPAYLMGWEEEYKEEYTEDELSEAKKKLIEKIKNLDEGTIAALNQIADSIIAKRGE
jgi:repressor LexA